MTMGRHAEALERMKKSQELDPLSLIINVAVGWAFYYSRRYEDAIEQLRRTLDLDPNYPVTYWILGLLLRKTGHYDLAIAAGREGGEAFRRQPPDARGAGADSGRGRQTGTRPYLNELTKLAQGKVRRALLLRRNPRGLGRQRARDRVLGGAYEERSHWLIYLNIDPGFDALRDNPRFKELLRRVGLAG